MNEEVLIEVPGFPGYYASNFGDIYSPYRKLKPRKDKYGYLQVSMYDTNGKQHTCKVHRIIALCFCPHKPWGADCVHHKDGNPANNLPTNLMWVSRREHAELHKVINNTKSRYLSKF